MEQRLGRAVRVRAGGLETVIRGVYCKGRGHDCENSLWTEGSHVSLKAPCRMKDLEDFEPSCPARFCAEQLVTRYEILPFSLVGEDV